MTAKRQTKVSIWTVSIDNENTINIQKYSQTSHQQLRFDEKNICCIIWFT